MKIKIIKPANKEVVETQYDKLVDICKKHMPDGKTKSSYNDCLLSDYINDNPDVIEQANRLRFMQMNIGYLWRDIICKLCDYRYTANKLLVNDKYVIQVKNAYNTDNASSRKANLKKLANYIKDNPGIEAIYGVINCNNENGRDETISCSNVEIRYLSGQKFLQFLFKDESERLLDSVKIIINMLITAKD